MIARNLVRIYAIRNTSISERRQKSVAIHIASMITPWRLNSLSAGNFLEWRDTGSPAGGCGVRHSWRLKPSVSVPAKTRPVVSSRYCNLQAGSLNMGSS